MTVSMATRLLLVAVTWNHICPPLLGHDDYMQNDDQEILRKEQGAKTKVILFWTKHWNREDYYYGFGRQPFLRDRCEYDACVTTSDRRRLAESAAVVVHANNVRSAADLPPHRAARQHWVFMNGEPPHLVRTDLRRLDGLFNLTMTYRWDSDLPMVYGYGVRRSAVLPDLTDRELDTLQIHGARRKRYRDKTHMALWYISNCYNPLNRTLYVSELAKHIHVDIYGSCVKRKCPHSSEECELKLRDYKFFLAFENSLCADYLTEKALKALLLGTVPVVLGGADYARLLPPRSYIDVMDFPSPRHLAAHLRRVGGSETLYNTYLQWTRRYRILYPVPGLFCDLCKFLHTRGEHSCSMHRCRYSLLLANFISRIIFQISEPLVQRTRSLPATTDVLQQTRT